MTNTNLNTNENDENTEVSMQDILDAWNGDGEITVTQSSSGEKVTPERMRELCDESIPGGVTTGIFAMSINGGLTWDATAKDVAIKSLEQKLERVDAKVSKLIKRRSKLLKKIDSLKSE